MSSHTTPRPRAGSATVALGLFTCLVVSGCGGYDPVEDEAPGSTSATVAKGGLDGPPVAVGPFLNGVLPTRTPNDLTSSSWQIIEAFPNLAFNQTLVIEPNPANNRIYVASRDGNIFSFDNMAGVATADPFLDIRDRAAVVWDGGFLGLVFHPQFGVPGSPFRNYVYMYYSSYCPLDGARDAVDLSNCDSNYPQGSTGGFFNTYLRLVRYEVPDGEIAADVTTERVMFTIRLYNGSHRGGGMVFDDDGYLIVTVGDQFRYETAQDIENNFEGGVLRLAVDITDNGDGTWNCPPGSHQPIRTVDTAIADGAPMNITDEVSGLYYCIPDDNPWVDLTGDVFEEFCSIGHRNPHRLAKDPLTGRMWSGEIGQSTREEVNVIACGNNYGWPFREGLVAGVRTQPPSYIGTLTDPVIDFVRTEARAIIGGYVYRGTKFPELYGKYLAGDYVLNNIWAITLNEQTNTATKELLTTFTPGGLATWGQDNDGEVYAGDVFGTDALYTLDRIGGPVPEPPALLSQTGAFADIATLEPSSYWVPYALNQPFWSDGAVKSRWIAVPNDGARDSIDEQIAYSETGNWGFPVGTVLMKHFELPLDENDPSIKTRLETRFVVLGDDDKWYFVTYRWRVDQSDADLLTTSETGGYTIQLEGGGTRNQTWYYPSRDDCALCHTDVSNGVLGARTHQQNGDFTYPATGRTDNQLATWNQLDMFAPAINEAAIPTLPRSVDFTDVTAPLGDRARSWLDSNCAQCHRPGGAGAGFDARFTTPFENQGMVLTGVRDDLGLPGMTILTPGDPILSALYQRGASVDPLIMMPPLAKTLAQSPAIDILGEWILRVDPGFGVNGINYEYFETGDLTALPDFDTLVPTTTGIVSTFDISVRLRDDNFAFRFTSLLYIDVAGAYTFFTSSDDGSQLRVDGAIIVDNDGLHGTQEQSGGVTLTQGYHTIEVTMFERTGAQTLSVSWQGPDTTGVKELISIGKLFLQEPSVNNDPPTLMDPGPLQHEVGDSVSVNLQAIDPNGDLLYFDAADLPANLTLDHTTGEISGNVAGSALGAHNVTASASDASEISVVEFAWTITQSPQPGCGDGNTDPGEECDDGNQINGDGCTAACLLEFCGDGIVNNGGTEACEPPGTGLCTSLCAIRLPLCGDGFLTPPEECEDGNVADGDGCSSTCTSEVPVACGDGFIDAGEECDDGNMIGGDGCALDCSFESGSELTQIGTIIARITSPKGSGNKDPEVIRDGDMPPAGDRSRDRQYDTYSGGAFAAEDWIGYQYNTDLLFGEVIFQEGREFSDGGYFLDVTVQVQQGGNWVDASGVTIAPTYTGDDGTGYEIYVFRFDPIVGDAIRIHGAPGGSKYFISIGELEVFAAASTTCGNGVIDAGEACDDGNLANGDGCSSACTIELPPACGDGNTDPGEECDDGNTANGDGCSSTCTIEPPPPACGDGIIDPGEECDDGNTANGDGCSSVCTIEIPPPACGDGNTDPGEECDDGNTANGDGCSSTCTIEAPPVCGDGNTDPGEECDDGNTANGDGCAFDCTFEGGTDLTQNGTIIARITNPRGSGNKDPEVIRDGDKPPVGDSSRTRQYDTYSGGAFAAEDWIGYRYASEQLFGQVVFQEGRNFSDGGIFIDVTVQVEQGGNWVDAPGVTVTPLYAGDDGISYNTYVFDFDAVLGDAIRIHGAPGGTKYFISIGELEVFAPVVVLCSNGVIDPGETCDDGNLANGDGCSSSCLIEVCGDGAINNNGTEDCEPPGTDVCTDTCTTRAPLCGDGFLTPPEACEDGNTADGDGCSSTCTIEVLPACGDGILDPGEECDDGNQAGGDGCSAVCVIEFCGDGVVNNGTTEQCDDGNNVDGDGCAFDCIVEGGGANLTQTGTIIARITNPKGSGSKDPEVIRDGDKPPVGDTSRSRQYDTYSGGAFAAEDWMGYEYTSDQLFGQVVFQEGRNFSDGGIFIDVTVQVRQGSTWVEAPFVTVTPAYAGDDGIGYHTYIFDFDPILGDAIRIHGAPGGTKYFISVGELEVFAAE